MGRPVLGVVRPLDMSRPLVSVCIPLTEDSRYISQCIESVYRQTYDNIEIIAVGKPRSESQDTRSEQKNRAILAARGEFIYTADADTALKEDAIEKALAMCESGFDSVAINNRSIPEGTLLSRIRAAEWDALRTSPEDSAAHFYRRSDVIKVGLFDESLYAGEDYDLHNRVLKAGGKFGIADSWRVHLGEPKSWSEVVMKNLHYSKNVPKYLSKHGAVKMSPFRKAYLRNVRAFGLMFFPFVVYKGIQYFSVFVGLLVK